VRERVPKEEDGCHPIELIAMQVRALNDTGYACVRDGSLVNVLQEKDYTNQGHDV
jgi:hypothetical protein